MALLEVDGVVAGYVDGIDILNGLRLRVEPGTVTGIIGPNGAGKSTCSRRSSASSTRARGGSSSTDTTSSACLRMPSSGWGSATRRRANIFPQFTVQENLQLGAWVLPAPGNAGAGVVGARLHGFPRLRQKRRRRATALSGGEAKMLSVAKELVTEPSLLAGRRAVGRARAPHHRAGLCPAAAGAAQGVTILLVDQNIAKAVEISDYLYMLEMGQVRPEGPRQALRRPAARAHPRRPPRCLT